MPCFIRPKLSRTFLTCLAPGTLAAPRPTLFMQRLSHGLAYLRAGIAPNLIHPCHGPSIVMAGPYQVGFLLADGSRLPFRTFSTKSVPLLRSDS